MDNNNSNGKLSTVSAANPAVTGSSLDVAVIVVSWNVRDYLADCLQSVNAELFRAGLRGKIWVVDNGSTDGTPEVLRSLFPNVALIANDGNPGFGAANNQGICAALTASPRYLFVLNPDTLIRPGAIKELVAFLDTHPNVGMVGPSLIYGSGRFQHSAFAFPGLRQLMFEFLPLPARLYETPLNGRYPRRAYRGTAFEVDHTLGAAMLVRRSVVESTNGFDESFFMYCEEIDWCWRIREAGWEIFTVPSAEIIHYGGESTKQIQSESIVNLWESRARFYRKHHDRIRLRLARRIVRAGLTRKAAQETLPELKDAYERAADAWAKP
ncbi:MAG: glycosyltransferase family 2 protein [Anaerolineae bacterium]|nr:glycosyltransferase family 2 protein [Anaerolineae bacterium]MCO5204440.1 glycosyltransferase family 2 protein [Anaerolineae bacterium]